MIKKNIKGFTLIELLVVVLIIGVLSSVALPQYRRSVEKAKFAEAAELMQAVSNAEQRYSLENGEYAEYFEDLDIVIPNKSGIKMSNKSILITDNFDISLGTVNDDALIVAGRRLEKGVAPEEKHRYALYRHVVTGEIFCEDGDEGDSIDCTMFAVTGNAVSCDDGTVSLTGAGGCPEEKEEVKPINNKEKETFKPVQEEAVEKEQKEEEKIKVEAPEKALNP